MQRKNNSPRVTERGQQEVISFGDVILAEKYGKEYLATVLKEYPESPQDQRVVRVIPKNEGPNNGNPFNVALSHVEFLESEDSSLVNFCPTCGTRLTPDPDSNDVEISCDNHSDIPISVSATRED